MTVEKAPPWGGAFVACIGVALALIGLLDPRDDAFPAGRAPVYAAGGAFFFSGLAMLTQNIREERLKTGLQGLIGTTILICFAAVPFSMALHDTGSSFLSLGASFLPCALLAGFAGFSTLKYIRGLWRDGARRPAKILAGVALGGVFLSGLAGWALKEPGAPFFDVSGAWEGEPWGAITLHREDGTNKWSGSYSGSATWEAGTLQVWVKSKKDPNGDGWGCWQTGTGRGGSFFIWQRGTDGIEGRMLPYPDTSAPSKGSNNGSFHWHRPTEAPLPH